MSRTYTRLPVALGSWQSNFVAIPAEFARAIRTSPDFAGQGVVALRLNWTGLKQDSPTGETESKEYYVGWSGTIARGAFLQVPDVLGDLSGLAPALAESKARGGSGLVVNVYALKHCAIASRVDVDPEAFEDWDVLERHAGFVESQMLSQICVLQPDQKFVVWVANIPVRLRVVSGVNAPCVKLANETEVIVAPKPRPDAPRPIGDLGESSRPRASDGEYNLGASAMLRLQPLVDDESTNGSVFVNGATLSLLREVAKWDASGEDSLGLADGVVATSRVNPSSPVLCRVVVSGEDESSSTTNGSAVYSVSISERIANGHVGMSRATRRVLHNKPFSRVRLVPVAYSPEMMSRNVPQSTVTLRRIIPSDQVSISSSSTTMAATSELLMEVMKRCITPKTCVLGNGSWLHLTASSASSSSFVSGLYKVVMGTASQAGQQQQKDNSRPFLFKDVASIQVIEWTLGEDLLLLNSSSVSSFSESKNISTTTSKDGEDNNAVKQQQDDEEDDSSECVWDDVPGGMNWTLGTLGGPAKKAGEELREHFAPLLSSKASLARVRLGTTPVGGAYLYGPRGSGKSTLVRALGKTLGLDKDWLTCVVRVECAALKGGKRSAIQKKLERAVQIAQARSPALVVLEDLDALLPQPSNPGEEDAQTVWLSEFLEGLVHQSRARQERFERAAREAIIKGRLSSFPDVSSWNKLAVGFVATGRGRKSMRTALTRLGMFEKRVEMPSLDLQGRRDVLNALCLAKHDMGISPVPGEAQLDVVAARTEGYSCADLETLVERAVHAKAVDEMDARDEQRTIPSGDSNSSYLEHALEGFTPSSLRGVKLAKSDTSWSDVGGLESVRDVLKETLELPFQFAELYDRSPQRLASGILLYGPPGCGKTLLAGAVASECGLNFISVKGPEVLNKYIGASEQAIRDLFARAASVTPCIVFFDEFDAVAPRRGSDSTGVTDRVVNQLLTFLDGVESRKGVYVMAATSRPDLVDPALLRPGRLDKQLYCGFPDQRERFSILSAVSSKLNMQEGARETTLSYIAEKGQELTGADLQALCATAQLLAVHEESPIITRDHLLRAFSDTRPSVGREDRAKFERIYKQFRGDRQAPSVTDNSSGFFSEDAKQKVALM